MNISGAGAFNACGLILGVPTPTPTVVVNLDIFFNISPTSYVVFANLFFDATGSFDFIANLNVPVVYHATAFTLQAFETNGAAPGGYYASNALEFAVAIPAPTSSL